MCVLCKKTVFFFGGGESGDRPQRRDFSFFIYFLHDFAESWIDKKNGCHLPSHGVRITEVIIHHLHVQYVTSH